MKDKQCRLKAEYKKGPARGFRFLNDSGVYSDVDVNT